MAAASGGASSGGANDDAGLGRAAGGPWRAAWGRTPGQGLQAPRVSRVGRVGSDAWQGCGRRPPGGLRVWRATLTAKYQVIVAAESELRVGIGLIKAIDWPNERSAHYSKPGR